MGVGTVHRDETCENFLSPGTVHRDETCENFLSPGTVHRDGCRNWLGLAMSDSQNQVELR